MLKDCKVENGERGKLLLTLNYISTAKCYKLCFTNQHNLLCIIVTFNDYIQR